DWRLRERNRPTQRLRQDLRRLRHRSYVTGKIDLAAVQGGGIGERARAEPADVVHRNHLQLRALPERPGQRGALETVRRQQVFFTASTTGFTFPLVNVRGLPLTLPSTRADRRSLRWLTCL